MADLFNESTQLEALTHEGQTSDTDFFDAFFCEEKSASVDDPFELCQCAH